MGERVGRTEKMGGTNRQVGGRGSVGGVEARSVGASGWIANY